MLRAKTERAVVRVLGAATLFVWASGALAAAAGSVLRVDWLSIDAGGGTATGGSFSVSGTIAQVDADPLQPSSGGNFELTGGFWAEAASDLVFQDDFEAP